jgi:hypothetical protein
MRESLRVRIALGNNRSGFQSQLPGRDAERCWPEVGFWEICQS